LIKLGYKSSVIDTCLFFRKKKDEDTLTITFVYVDDGGCIGTMDAITSTLKYLSQDFSIKVLGPLKSYIGCNLIEDKANQQMLIKNMEKTSGSQLTVRVVHVPSTSKTSVVRPQNMK